MKILIVEDNAAEIRLIKELLSESGDFTIDSCDSVESGLKCLNAGKYDVVLLDLNVVDSRGIETFNRMSHLSTLVPIIILTGIHDNELAIHAVRQGAQDYIEKNCLTGDGLYKSILYAIERHEHLLTHLSVVETIKANMQSIVKNLDDVTKQINELIRERNQ